MATDKNMVNIGCIENNRNIVVPSKIDDIAYCEIQKGK